MPESLACTLKMNICVSHDSDLTRGIVNPEWQSKGRVENVISNLAVNVGLQIVAVLYTCSTVILAWHELVFLFSVLNCILFSVQSMMQLAVSFGFAMGPAIGGGLQEVI